ncbi:hypothetical protein KCU83_g13, partial [Aureobasidium melanogenum]
MPAPAVTQRRSYIRNMFCANPSRRCGPTRREQQYFDIGCVQKIRLTVSLITRAVRDIRMIGCQNICMVYVQQMLGYVGLNRRPSLGRLVTWCGLSTSGK